MAEVHSEEFAVNLFVHIDMFSLRKMEGTAVCFSTKKNAARVVL